MTRFQKTQQLYHHKSLGPIHSIHKSYAKFEKKLLVHPPVSQIPLPWPHFLGIGAPRCGTTWLHNNLRAHSDIFIPPDKELHFFDRRWDESLMLYLLKFARSKSKLRGEITPAYGVLSPSRIKFISQINPQLKLILLLRNPIDRAWSHVRYMQNRKNPTQDQNHFKAKDIREMISHPRFLIRSDYPNMIQNWTKYFPKDQLFIGYYYNLQNRPRTLLRKIFSFLDLSPPSSFKNFPSNTKFNSSQSLSMPTWLHKKFTRQFTPQIHHLHQLLGDPIKPWLESIR